MNDQMNPTTTLAVQSLYNHNADARKLFDWMASLQRDAESTTIDRLTQKLGISRNAAVLLVRELENAGCGEFVVGRRGSRSRFRWDYSRVSLGLVASGEADEIEQVSDPISEKDEDLMTIDASGQNLTIARAKDLLAASLGLKPDQIEIQIRA